MTRPWFKRSRDPALVERDLQRYRDRHPHLFPQVEAHDLTRGEARFAAEVVLASGKVVLPDGMVERARASLSVMANAE